MAILPFCQTPFGSSHLSVHVSLFYKQKKELVVPLFNYCGAPGEIRTPDRLVRSQVLYPAELRARTSKLLIHQRLKRCERRRTEKRNYSDTARRRQHFFAKIFRLPRDRPVTR